MSDMKKRSSIWFSRNVVTVRGGGYSRILRNGLVALVSLAASTLPGRLDAANLAENLGLVDAYAGTKAALPFRYDSSIYSGGNLGGDATYAIDLSGENCWGPEKMYQQERYVATLTITLPNLVAGADYVVELHLTENYFDATGRRVFNVAINGTTVQQSVDIYKLAGKFKALCLQYNATANSEGKIVVTLQRSVDNAHMSGIAVWGSAVPSGGTFDVAMNGTTANLTWSGWKDTFRYYVQTALSANGPWTDVGGGEVLPSVNSLSLANRDISSDQYYRLIASNGVGVVTQDVKIGAPSPDGFTVLATRGSTIANDSSANLRIATVAPDTDPLNALAADDTKVNFLFQDAAGESTLQLLAGQSFAANAIAILSGAGDLTIGDTPGVGTVSSTSGGPLVLRVDDAASRLTVNALFPTNGSAPVVTKTGAGTAQLPTNAAITASIGIGDGTVELPVEADDEQNLDAVLNGSGTFAKTGAGTLIVTNLNPSMIGSVEVREGTLRFGRTGALFAADPEYTLAISNGATLDVSAYGLAAQGVNLGTRTVFVEGAGVDGKGAIVNNGNTSQYNALKNGALTGDAVFGGLEGDAATGNVGSRWDFRDGSFAMNGHNITKIGSNMVCFTGIKLTEGGTVKIDVNEGTWSSETTTSYSGGSSNSLNIAGGAMFDLYNLSVPFTWTMNIADGGMFYARNGSLAQNQIAGPVTLTGGTATFKAAANQYATFSGPISGPGQFKLVSAGGSRITLDSGANTYSGGTWIQGGDLHVVSKGDLPNYDDPEKLVITNGTLMVTCADGHWLMDDLQKVVDRGQLKGSGSYLSVNTISNVLVDTELNIPEGSFSRYGTGEMHFTMPITIGNGHVDLRTGSFLIDGVQAGFHGNGLSLWGNCEFTLTNGATLLSDATGNGSAVRLGRTANTTTTMNIHNSTVKTPEEVPYNTGSTGLVIGDVANSRGILTVDGNSMVSNKYIVGNAAYAQGAIYQYGGTIVNSGGANNDIRVGVSGYGYQELNSGKLTFMGYSQIGYAGANSVGIFVQKGGEFEQNTVHVGRFAICRGNAAGGAGVVYQSGGDFNVLSWVEVGESDNHQGGTSCWTIDGANAKAYVRDYVNLSNRTNHTAVLNLNNGILETQYITARTSKGAADKDTAHAYVNFNGGTFRTLRTGAAFITGNNAPDAVTIYEGGAVFDSSNFNATVSVPLEKPAGQGVASITIPTSTMESGREYIGPPHVAITGGGGVGATAIVEFDSRTRKLGNVIVTSPGTGYTSAPTVTVSGGGYTNAFTGTATLANNATTGGLTKRGTGMITLDATNTFGGTVTVEEGTLQAKIPEAFPEGNALALSGGKFTVPLGVDVTAGVVTGTSGGIMGGNLICSSLTKTGDGELLLTGARVHAASGITVSGGTLQLQGFTGKSTAEVLPGLYTGVLSGSNNRTDPEPKGDLALGTTQANTTSGWEQNTTVVYSGYIWNNDSTNVTWTFAENFDDTVLLLIDGVTVLDNSGWKTVTKNTVTLAPGPHRFVVRLGQGTGGAGPSSDSEQAELWPANTLGFGIDFEGRDSFDVTYFTAPVDPGDGSLFTTEATSAPVNVFGDSLVTVANGATLSSIDGATVPVANLAGSGSISNIAAKVTGTLTVDAAEFTQGNHLTVADGSLDISQLTTVSVLNAASLMPGSSYVIATAEESVTGNAETIQLSGVNPDKWHLATRNGQLLLTASVGTILFIR
ncbi:MAG: autotransporter-associated beta strand repeat-containing protein [Kiritimatiellae bacterium]|nr:autotransporter-associated beta strand repeat-containing protein [Kiritimatiellia bacterium]